MKELKKRKDVNKNKQTNYSLKTIKLFFIPFLVLVIVIAGLLYIWTTIDNSKKNTDEQISQLDKKIGKRNKKIEKLTEELVIITTQQQENKHKTEKTVNKLTDKIKLLEKKLTNLQNNINEDPVELKEEVSINEVLFLIQKASIYYALNKSQNITKRLLKLALKRVKLIQRSGIIELTTAIKKDLVNLSYIEKENISEKYVSLNLLISDMNNWPNKITLFESKQKKSEPKITKQNNDDKKGWYDHLKESTTSVLQKWFQVVHHKEKVSPILSRQDTVYIKRAIKMQLQEAQWALLQNKQNLLVEILTNTKKKIIKTYNRQDKKVEKALSMIEEIIVNSLGVKPTDYLLSEKAIIKFIKKIKEQDQP